MAPCVMRRSILRIVSDILENRDLVVHARLWRSPKVTPPPPWAYPYICTLSYMYPLLPIPDAVFSHDMTLRTNEQTMRSAAQIATHCWMDEEVRLNASRVSGRGVICNLANPMGSHVWPVDNQVLHHYHHLLSPFAISICYHHTTITICCHHTTITLLPSLPSAITILTAPYHHHHHSPSNQSPTKPAVLRQNT